MRLWKIVKKAIPFAKFAPAEGWAPGQATDRRPLPLHVVHDQAVIANATARATMTATRANGHQCSNHGIDNKKTAGI